jgi:acyl carrier protein
VPIGRPIANTQIYLLDATLNPVPIGIAGELHIGGVGVGRGYLNQPTLTAEKFIPNPFAPRSRSGARLYRTGDLARYLPDGNIEFLGRMDDQVKIRGFRIELGEIEATLGRHPNVQAAVVVARDLEHRLGDKRLIAYIVSKHEPAPTADELRDWVRTRLPDYMMPATFVFLEALPLTASGKVNRRALPAPDASRLERATEYRAPETPLEETLAEIWEQALGIERIGIDDNVFTLGGHSLLATHGIHQINETFEIHLPLRSLFEEPTVAGLAVLVEETLIKEIKTRPQTREVNE